MSLQGGVKEDAAKEKIFPTIPVDKRRPIRVLSLFDGIATGIVALKTMGFEIGKFVASEIDEDALRIVQMRHPEVIHVGDIEGELLLIYSLILCHVDKIAFCLRNPVLYLYLHRTTSRLIVPVQRSRLVPLSGPY